MTIIAPRKSVQMRRSFYIIKRAYVPEIRSVKGDTELKPHSNVGRWCNDFT